MLYDRTTLALLFNLSKTARVRRRISSTRPLVSRICIQLSFFSSLFISLYAGKGNSSREEFAQIRDMSGIPNVPFKEFSKGKLSREIRGEKEVRRT